MGRNLNLTTYFIKSKYKKYNDQSWRYIIRNNNKKKNLELNRITIMLGISIEKFNNLK
jgi:hypothetical protein